MNFDLAFVETLKYPQLINRSTALVKCFDPLILTTDTGDGTRRLGHAYRKALLHNGAQNVSIC